MKRPGLLAAIAVLALGTGCEAGDAGPASGSYCAQKEPAKCATISFPPKRGTGAPGTMQIAGKRYEVSWMDSEGGHRRYLANPPSGTVVLEMSAGASGMLVVKWRDKQPDETYVLK